MMSSQIPTLARGGGGGGGGGVGGGGFGGVGVLIDKCINCKHQIISFHLEFISFRVPRSRLLR